MKPQNLLIVSMFCTLMLGVVLAASGSPVWALVVLVVLGGVMGAGAIAAPRRQ